MAESTGTAGSSNESVQVIAQFKEVCDTDTEIARTYLAQSGWNLQNAVTQYLMTNDPGLIENEDNRRNEQMQELRHRQQPQTIPPSRSIGVAPNSVARVPVTGWIHWMGSFFVLPIQFFYSSVTKVFLFLYVLLLNPNTPIARARRNRAIANQAVAVNPDRVQRNQQNSQLMRQQEQEYRNSLAADKAKKDKQIKDEQKRKDEEKRVKEEAKLLEDKKRRLVAKQDDVRLQMSREPTEGDIIFIKFKFPGGTTYNRKFNADSRISDLFNAVFVHENCPEDFSLLTGFPAVALNCAPEWYREFGAVGDPENIPSLKDVGLQKTAVILIRDNNA